MGDARVVRKCQPAQDALDPQRRVLEHGDRMLHQPLLERDASAPVDRDEWPVLVHAALGDLGDVRMVEARGPAGGEQPVADPGRSRRRHVRDREHRLEPGALVERQPDRRQLALAELALQREVAEGASRRRERSDRVGRRRHRGRTELPDWSVAEAPPMARARQRKCRFLAGCRTSRDFDDPALPGDERAAHDLARLRPLDDRAVAKQLRAVRRELLGSVVQLVVEHPPGAPGGIVEQDQAVDAQRPRSPRRRRLRCRSSGSAGRRRSARLRTGAGSPRRDARTASAASAEFAAAAAASVRRSTRRRCGATAHSSRRWTARPSSGARVVVAAAARARARAAIAVGAGSAACCASRRRARRPPCNTRTAQRCDVGPPRRRRADVVGHGHARTAATRCHHDGRGGGWNGSVALKTSRSARASWRRRDRSAPRARAPPSRAASSVASDSGQRDSRIDERASARTLRLDRPVDEQGRRLGARRARDRRRSTNTARRLEALGAVDRQQPHGVGAQRRRDLDGTALAARARSRTASRSARRRASSACASTRVDRRRAPARALRRHDGNDARAQLALVDDAVEKIVRRQLAPRRAPALQQRARALQRGARRVHRGQRAPPVAVGRGAALPPARAGRHRSRRTAGCARRAQATARWPATPSHRAAATRSCASGVVASVMSSTAEWARARARAPPRRGAATRACGTARRARPARAPPAQIARDRRATVAASRSRRTLLGLEARRRQAVAPVGAVLASARCAARGRRGGRGKAPTACRRRRDLGRVRDESRRTPLGHRRAEDRVDRADAPPGALRRVWSHASTLPPSPSTDEARRRGEHARLGAPESVDALLRIADDEDARRLLAARATAGAGVGRQPGVQRVPLQRAGVLELVDQQMADARVEPLLHPAGELAVAQQRQRAALEIGHVGVAACALVVARTRASSCAAEPDHAQVFDARVLLPHLFAASSLQSQRVDARIRARALASTRGSSSW